MVSGRGNVYYARTTKWSINIIDGGRGNSAEMVNFTLNPGVTPGHYELIVYGSSIQPIDIQITEDGVEGGH